MKLDPTSTSWNALCVVDVYFTEEKLDSSDEVYGIPFSYLTYIKYTVNAREKSQKRKVLQYSAAAPLENSRIQSSLLPD